MKRLFAAILWLLLATAPAALAAPGFEELPEGERPDPAELLPARDGDPVELFRYRPDPGAGPTIRPDPPLAFVPPAPFDGERPGWFLESAGMVATNALADFRLRTEVEPGIGPADPPPPRTEAVPEPGTLLLMFAGVLLLMFFRRRRAAAR